MSSPNTLAVVLAFRKRKEEQEERALAVCLADQQQIRTTLARVERELQLWSEPAVRGPDGLDLAATQQARYARWKGLRETRLHLLDQLQAAENRRLEQQAHYLAARSGREMLTELVEQQRAADEIKQQRAEQLQLDDLFASRRPRH